MSHAASPLAAFHRIGDRTALELVSPETLILRPALFAKYHDLSRLRTDYPVILVTRPGDGAWIRSLSDVIDDLLRSITEPGTQDEEMRRQVLAVEQLIREQASGGNDDLFSRLWNEASKTLISDVDDQSTEGQKLESTLRDAGAAIPVDGFVVNCDRQLSIRLISRAWKESEKRRSHRLQNRVGRLAQKLRDILQANDMHSPRAHHARQLAGALGQADQTVFDFKVMARVLKTAPTADPLPASRRNRIKSAIEILDSKHFILYPTQEDCTENPPYEFLFDDCGQALEAFRERLPEMAALVRAISIAELEINNHYRESRHDPFFDRFDQDTLGPDDLELFPGYLVALENIDEQAEADILHILRSGLPIKVIAQTQDILGDDSLAGGQLMFGTRGQQLGRMAIGLDRVFVLQAAASSLYRLRESVMQGVSIDGPALFSIYAGDGYLESAAATESRAFPGFVFNPHAGQDLASRFLLAGNPGSQVDWTEHELHYEDSDHNSQFELTAFTLVDFVAHAPQFARHFAAIPADEWSEELIPVSRFLKLSRRDKTDKIPYVLLADDNHLLYRAIVDEKLLDAAERCLISWHNLQEMAGINNSHAMAAVSKARAETQPEPASKSESPAQSEPKSPAPVSANEPAENTPPATEEAAPASDDPWIETIRCTTCNECTQLNDRMFAYDDEKRAYVADPDAGTYRELVEAAESCQVAIIHPGKPRNPDEPDLEALQERAAPFL